MKKRWIALLGLTVWLTTLSCKQQEKTAEAENSSNEAIAADTVATNPLTTEAATAAKDPSKKFVKTGTIRVQVDNVVQTTHRIEQAVSSAGGFVTHTKMESLVDERKETEISTDSILVTTQYHTENEMVIRVPTMQLNTLLQALSKEVIYVDYRTIDNEEVSAQMVANALERQRKKESAQRLEKGIDQRSAQLKQVIEAEKEREVKISEQDTKVIENMRLNDQVKYATIALKLYQNSSIKQERLASMAISERLRPAFGMRAWNNIKTGWFALENILSFLILFWPLALLGGLGYFTYQRFIKK